MKTFRENLNFRVSQTATETTRSCTFLNKHACPRRALLMIHHACYHSVTGPFNAGLPTSMEVKYRYRLTCEVPQYYSINSSSPSTDTECGREGSASANKAVVTDSICLSGDKDVCVLHRLAIMENCDLLYRYFCHSWQFALPLVVVNRGQQIFHCPLVGSLYDGFWTWSHWKPQRTLAMHHY